MRYPSPRGNLYLMDPLIADLQRLNPWWEGKPMQVLPRTRRHLVQAIHQRLERQLAPAVVVRGPRQVGKTIAQLQVLQDLLDRGVAPRRILRVQCDELPELTKLSEPILRIVDWFEQNVLGATLNEAAHADQPAYVFLDGVQNLPHWAVQLKFLVDNSTAHVVVTDSSALRIEMGRDSLAGRITTIEAGVLSLTEIGEFHDLELGRPFLPDNGLEALARKSFWQELADHGCRMAPARDSALRWFSERAATPWCTSGVTHRGSTWQTSSMKPISAA